MSGPAPVSRDTVQASGESRQTGDGSAVNKAPPDPLAGSPAAIQGRLVLSTAVVRIGPDGRLTVELKDGRVLLLRDVVMGPRSYCGVQQQGGQAGDRYCGGYAEVVAARPGS